MQRRSFLTSLLSLAAVTGALAQRKASLSAAPPETTSQLPQLLRQLHAQLLPLAPRNTPAHPANEALALTAETISRLQQHQQVSPGLLQNLSDAVARTEQVLAIRLHAGLTPVIAQEIRRLAG
jgi:hypothetical protein